MIEIAYSDNTVATAKILNFDGRFGDNHDGYCYAGGFVRTDVGIFDGFYAYENLFETEKACFALGLGTYDFVEETPRYTDFYKYFALVRTNELAWSLGGGYNWEFSLDRQIFEGELTNKNIDAMMYTARYLVGYLYDVDYSTKEISGDIARAMLAKIFNVRNIDLTLSNFYNPNEDIYEFAVFDSGWGDGGILETYDIDIYGDCYYITKIVDDLKGEHLYTYYAFFESDGRCSYFNSTPKKFTSLEIETLPNKTEYFVGDTIDLGGLKLKYTDEFDQVTIIETEFDTNITILDSTEIKDITITYKGLDVKIPVNVKSLELTKISVNALPNKLYYKCGDMFDSTGLKLLLTHNSGKTEIIDSGFICIPELLSVAGNQVVAVMYGGLTTTFTVNVSEAGNVVNGKVNSVSVSDTSLAYKATTTITPTISADAGVEYTVTYSSSNPSVASVDENGKVTTGKTGSATITVTVTDEYGNTVTDTCDVSVNYNWWQWIIVIVLFGWIWY
ncbi:MAG: bacterial Ig-like domain-containing protein [Clostridia bacterium]|nr:bacterial Ig-like domain-containing protein [Clostridia bacterium]